MDLALSEEQQTWHDAAVRFAQAELVDDVLGRDERREFWREGWRRCAGFGIQGLPVPTEYRRARGRTCPPTIAAMEGLGYGCPDNGLIFAINASLWTVTMPILALRHRGAEAALPAGPLRRPPRRRQRRQRARGGLGHLQHAGPRRASRRRLGAQRPQDLGHERPGGRPLRLLRDDRPEQGGPGHHRLPRPARDARLPRRARDPQARRPHGADGRAGVRGLRAPRRGPARPGGAGGRGLQLLDGVGAGGDPGRHARARCGGSSSAASSTPGRRKQFGQPIGKFQAVANGSST